MAIVTTYTETQIERIPQLNNYIEYGSFNPNEYNEIRELGIEPEVYFDALGLLLKAIDNKPYSRTFIPNIQQYVNEVPALYMEHVKYGCDGLLEIDHLLIGACETWGCLFCPCCAVELDPKGKVGHVEDIVGFIPDKGYVIKDTRTGEVIYANELGFHLATEHRSSAGINYKKMVKMLNLEPREPVHPSANN